MLCIGLCNPYTPWPRPRR